MNDLLNDNGGEMPGEGKASTISARRPAIRNKVGTRRRAATPAEPPRDAAAVPAIELVTRLRSEAAHALATGFQRELADDHGLRNGSADACAHLGLEQDPFAHRPQPSSEHRCYLWMQRDRIDLAHQAMFCLTEQSATCPWLTISNPQQNVPLRSRAAQAVAERLPARLDELDSPWQRFALTALVTCTAWAERAWLFLEPLLLQLGLWIIIGPCRLSPVLGKAVADLSGKIKQGTVALQASRLGERWRTISRKGQQPSGSVSSLETDIPARPDGGKVAEAEAPVHPALEREAGAQFPAGPLANVSSIPIDAVHQMEEAGMAAETYLRRGMEAVRDGDTAAALRRFRLATAADEQNEQAWLLRGAVADSRDEKAECFRRALALNPLSTRARAGLAQLGITPDLPNQKGKSKRAFSALQQAGIATAYEEAEEEVWPCSDCRALNPVSRATCSRCGRPSPQVERELVGGGSLLRSGLDALHVGSEELAYEYFISASEAEPNNEQAWYWRAKTAPSLDELIQCLQHIVEINPANAKVQADLAWALQRRQREQFTAVVAKPAEKTAARSKPSRAASFIRGVLLSLASAASFALGLLLTLPSAMGITDWATVPELRRYLSYLPEFKMPAIPIQTEFAPVFDLGAALPFIAGVLLFHAAFSLGEGSGRAIRIWTSLLAIGAAALLLIYANPASSLGAALAMALFLTALAGKARTGATSHQNSRSML